MVMRRVAAGAAPVAVDVWPAEPPMTASGCVSASPGCPVTAAMGPD